jgi:Zn-dependent peptidase ImmA (M78 family)
VTTLAHRANIAADKVREWEAGERLPTFRQAKHVAGTLHIPFGYLFLSEPPLEQLQLPDFRRVRAEAAEASAELIDVIDDVLVKQQWYREYAPTEGHGPLPFVGKFTLNDDTEQIAADISRSVGLSRIRQEASGWADFLGKFVHAVERTGILVMKSSIVGGNVHRKLAVSEFRGFTVSDKIAPAIFINSSDARAAQIFTLAHELAHVWLDRSGVSNERLDSIVTGNNADVEVKCNAIAAETLVPKHEFTWDKKSDIDTNLRVIGRSFGVSSLVVLRRGHDLGFVKDNDFTSKFKLLLDSFIAKEEEQSGGGDFYPTLYSRNSTVFTETLLGALKQGYASYTEASRMLHVKVPTLAKIIGDLESKAV